MMYMKKGPLVKAVQWFKKGDHPDVVIGDGCEFGTYNGARIAPGDWIINGLDHPVSDKWFKEHYTLAFDAHYTNGYLQFCNLSSFDERKVEARLIVKEVD